MGLTGYFEYIHHTVWGQDNISFKCNGQHRCAACKTSCYHATLKLLVPSLWPGRHQKRRELSHCVHDISITKQRCSGCRHQWFFRCKYCMAEKKCTHLQVFQYLLQVFVLAGITPMGIFINLHKQEAEIHLNPAWLDAGNSLLIPIQTQRSKGLNPSFPL